MSIEKIQHLLRTNHEFKTDTLDMLKAYKSSNWRLARERRQFREKQRNFQDKWDCDFSVIVFRYHDLQPTITNTSPEQDTKRTPEKVL